MALKGHQEVLDQLQASKGRAEPRGRTAGGDEREGGGVVGGDAADRVRQSPQVALPAALRELVVVVVADALEEGRSAGRVRPLYEQAARRARGGRVRRSPGPRRGAARPRTSYVPLRAPCPPAKGEGWVAPPRSPTVGRPAAGRGAPSGPSLEQSDGGPERRGLRQGWCGLDGEDRDRNRSGELVAGVEGVDDGLLDRQRGVCCAT